jgi:ABC-type branched-subunit amino acid transport system substrate-binding protein
MNRSRLAVALAGAVLIAACSARGGDDTADTADAAATATTATATTAPTATETTAAPTDEVTATTAAPEETTTTAAPGVKFGTLDSPCGPGDATIAEGQNGGATLKLGTPTDHGYEASPGLTIEMLDAAEAFAGWCNEQGGIGGLPLEIVDLDGKLFAVPPAMEQACAETFALVGGGWVFDDQMFPRFHECGMISFPGYTVTPTAAMANGKVQPIPNPSNVRPAGWLMWAKENYPEQIAQTAIMYGDFQTTKVVADQLKATMDAVGGFTVTDSIPYSPAGEANWAPFAQRLKDNGIRSLFYVGAPANLVLLYKAMNELGYVPELVLNDANFYDEIMVAEGNAALSEGFKVRTAYAPFEEAADFPGMQSYIDMMATYNPDGKIAGLGLQATSAMLLFATAAKACLESNDNVLERECVRAEGLKVSSWTGGGLHTETNPGANAPPTCGIIMEVRDGAWHRLHPEVGAPGIALTTLRKRESCSPLMALPGSSEATR